MKVYVIGTCDTKERELVFAKELIQAAGVPAVLVDVGTKGASRATDVPASDVARHHPDGVDAVLGKDDRGEAVGAVLGLGGSGNTALVTAAMRTLPVGTPKLMVSTVASGNTATYVGPT